MQVNEQIQQIKPSATMQIAAKAKTLKAEGHDVVTFGTGEPDFDTPDFIKQAAIQAINSGDTKYTVGAGTPALRSAISNRIQADYQLGYEPAQVLVSNGAKQSVYNLLRTAINPGDEVIIFAPYWVSYPDMVRLADGVPVAVHGSNDNGFLVTPEQLESVISTRTKGIILNNPSNPTGAGYNEEQQRALAEVIKKHDLWVISDEIYDKLVYGEHKHVPYASLNQDAYNRTATVNGVSKAYAMTGWRIGYAAGPQNWISAASKLQGQSTSCASSISQAAATEAFSADQSVVEDMRLAFSSRRDLILDLVRDIPGMTCNTPQGAFYVFPSIKNVYGPYNNSMEWASALLEKQNVALVPGGPFGGEGHIRLSYATSESEIKKGLARIREFVQTL